MSTTSRSRSSAAASALALTLALAGCGSSGSTTSSSGTPASTPMSTSTSASTATAAALTVTDAWCKSTDSMPADATSMTGCFGTLVNSTDKAIHLTGGTSPAAKMVELHETVKNATGDMVMQPAKDGFTVPANGTFVLAPGANHVMLMQLVKALDNGTTLQIVLSSDSGDFPIDWAVRTYSGGNESYQSSPSDSMGSMSHS